MATLCGSLRIEEGSVSVRRISRSERWLVDSETSEVARIVGYEKISESIRMSESDNNFKRTSVWSHVSRIFSTRKIEDPDPTKISGAKKKRSSWLPDPDRRWPVQGW